MENTKIFLLRALKLRCETRALLRDLKDKIQVRISIFWHPKLNFLSNKNEKKNRKGKNFQNI